MYHCDHLFLTRGLVDGVQHPSLLFLLFLGWGMLLCNI